MNIGAWVLVGENIRRNAILEGQTTRKKNSLVVWLRSRQIQITKTMTNGATYIKKGAAEFHKLLPRCKDHPVLLLTLLELVEPVVVVPVGGRTVGVSTSVEVMPVEVGEDADDDEVPETGEEVRVMAKAGLMSPESPSKQMM